MNIESVNNDNLNYNSHDTTKIVNLSMKKEEILKTMLNILGISYDTIDEIQGKDLDRDLLLEHDIVNQLMVLKPAIRSSGYKSGKLTSLHKNNESQQKFPGINMVRQVLKCNGYKLHPYVISLGYDHETGKKLTKRKFNIHKIEIEQD
jgi:hypothetical protein